MAAALDLVYKAAARAFNAFNIAEGLFWLLVGALFALHAFRHRRRSRPPGFAALFFALFGISDFIETATGAWWRPWWLLALKGGCAAGLLCCYIVHVRAGGYRGLAQIYPWKSPRGD